MAVLFIAYCYVSGEVRFGCFTGGQGSSAPRRGGSPWNDQRGRAAALPLWKHPPRGWAIIKSRLCRKAAKVGGGQGPLLVCAYITGCRPLALPLGELSPQVTERVGMVMVCPLRPRCARPPLPKGEARDAHTVHQNVCRGGALPRPFSQSLRHGFTVTPPFAQGRLWSSAPAGAGTDCHVAPLLAMTVQGRGSTPPETLCKQEGQSPSCLLFHPIAAPVILRSRRPGRRRSYPPPRRSPPTAHGSARRPRSSPSPAVPAPPSPSPACCSRRRSDGGGP